MGTKYVRRREVYWRKRAAKRIKWGLEHSSVVEHWLPCSSLPNSEKSWENGDKHHRLNKAWEGLGRSKSRGGVWEDNRRKQGNPPIKWFSEWREQCKQNPRRSFVSNRYGQHQGSGEQTKEEGVQRECKRGDKKQGR